MDESQLKPTHRLFARSELAGAATLLEFARALTANGVLVESAQMYRPDPSQPGFELRADVRFDDTPLSRAVRSLADTPGISGLVLKTVTDWTTFVLPM